MAGGLLNRKRVIAVEAESVEGTAETLVAADGTMLVYEASFEPAIEIYKRAPARSILSRLAGVPGKQTGVCRWKTELKGSGAVTTHPAWHDALMCCGFSVSTITVATIHAITGGPLFAAELVKNATRSKVARVVGDTATGAATLAYVPTSGTAFSAEVITGVTSAATTKVTGTPVSNKGFEYLPDSTTPPSATVGAYLDGTRNILSGCRGNVRIASGAVGEPVFLEFEFMGVMGTAVDTALLSPTYETTVPSPFLSASPVVLGYSSAVLATMTFDAANTLAQREDASATKGVRSYLITDRAPTLTADPEMELVATHDFFGSLQAGTTGRCYFKLGSAAGNTIKVGFPKCQYSGLAEQDRAGIAVVGASLDVLGSGVNASTDDDIQIAML